MFTSKLIMNQVLSKRSYNKFTVLKRQKADLLITTAAWLSLPHSILLTLDGGWSTKSKATIAFICCIISYLSTCCTFKDSILNSWGCAAVCNCNWQNIKNSFFIIFLFFFTLSFWIIIISRKDSKMLYIQRNINHSSKIKYINK